jgi:hypothetical protein
MNAATQHLKSRFIPIIRDEVPDMALAAMRATIGAGVGVVFEHGPLEILALRPVPSYVKYLLPGSHQNVSLVALYSAS